MALHSDTSSSSSPSVLTMTLFKFKKADALCRIVDFPQLPAWDELALEISNLFNIPQTQVGVAYVGGPSLSIMRETFRLSISL